MSGVRVRKDTVWFRMVSIIGSAPDPRRATRLDAYPLSPRIVAAGLVDECGG
jgi:hypothetical protein